jgi:hypothetical protein
LLAVASIDPIDPLLNWALTGVCPVALKAAVDRGT